MGKITENMVHAAYKAAKDVYDEKKSKKNAIDELHSYYGVNKNSASDYIEDFKRMMGGKVYKRGLSLYSTEYFFASILSDYGTAKLSNALRATQANVEYYENITNKDRLKDRLLIEKYQLKLNEQIKLDNQQYKIPEEITNKNNYFEGAKKTITVNAYERDTKVRTACIEYHGKDCKVCGFNFEKTYGEIGKDYIHVHHIKPLSEIKEGYQINPIKDLIPVCPNCHAMLHKKKSPYTIQELKEFRKKINIKNRFLKFFNP